VNVPEPDEREIRVLSDRSGVPLAQVRRLFCDELRRLGKGAKVGSYLALLTSSSVRGMLRRKTRPAEPAPLEHLQRWEDEGGRTGRAQ